jgi:TPR repeat protein
MPLPSLYINPSKFYQKACDLNFSGGCYNLGLMYEKGKGVKQNDFKVVKFYQKACNPRLEQPVPAFKSHAFW